MKGLAYFSIIGEGINRITAKLLCQANPANLTKFYSINVTGTNGFVPRQFAITHAILPTVRHLYLYQTPLTNHLSLPTNSISSASIGSSGSLHRSIYDKDHFNGKNSTCTVRVQYVYSTCTVRASRWLL